MIVLALVALYCCAQITSARVLYVGDGFEYKTNELVRAVADAQTNDIVELRAAEYVLPHDGAGVCLSIQRSITLRAGTGVTAPPIIRAQTADGTDVVIGVGASNVRLENIVIGRPASGAQVNIGRVIAVLVSAGTQAEPSAFGSVAAYGANLGKRSAPVGAVRAARELKKRASTVAQPDDQAPNRVLVGVSVVNVDFTASLAHTNLAFGPGAYVGARVLSCRFAESSDSNSIVTAVGSRFDDAVIERNSFGGSPVVLNGAGLTLGGNYWASALRKDQPIFCLDRSCTRFGPVIDADAPTRAFRSIVDAHIAGVQHIALTVHDVEWATDAASACAIIHVAETTIEGLDITECAPQSADNDGGLGATNINVRHLCKSGAPGAVSTYEGALSSVRNVQFTLHPGVTTGIAVVQNRGGVTAGTPAALLLFDNVKVYGSAGQTAFAITSPATRVLFNEVEVLGVSVGVSHRSGMLSVTDSLILVEEVGIHLVGGPGAKHGLRVGDTLFFKATGVSFGDVPTTGLTDFQISCSRFLFSSIRMPTDCKDNVAACASALRHNSFIATPGSLEPALRELLSRGANHYEEEDSLLAAEQYYKYTDDTKRAQFAFQLNDNQGRIDDVSGLATIGGAGTHWTFALVTHVPVRAECFAARIPSLDGNKGRVVSNLFDLRTDAPRACVSVALRVSLLASDVDLQPNEDMAIYAVEHVGSASATWTRAASHTIRVADDGTSTAVDASSGRGELVRAVVVAAHSVVNSRYAATIPDSSSAPAVKNQQPVLAAPPVAAHAALAITRATRQLCVACGGDRIPAGVLDERCGGGSAPVFETLDSAIAALSASKSATASLLVYGSKCVSSACTIELGAMSPNKLTVEGLSPTERGSIRRPSSCAASVSFIRAGLGVTLRYLLIAPDTRVASAIPTCAIEAVARAADGPRLAYLTVAGGVCIGKGRTNTVLLNNEITVAAGRAMSIDDSAAKTTLDSNVIVGGSVRIGAAPGVQLVNNAFGAGGWLDIADGAQIVGTGNTFGARRADASAPLPCLVAAQTATTQFDQTEFGDHCEIRLTGSSHQLSGGVWRGVRAFVTGPTHLVGVTIGSAAYVQATNGVILDNVVVDMQVNSIGGALRGTPVRTTGCSKDHEPALGGFALERSSVYDQAGAVLIKALVWPRDVNSYVDFDTAQIKSCATGEKTPYCSCAAPKTKSGVQVKPSRERVASKEVVPLAQAVARVQKSSPVAKPPQSVPPIKQTRTFAPLAGSSSTASSHTVVWVLLGVLIAVFVCLCIVLAVAYARSLPDTTTTTSTAGRRTHTTKTSSKPLQDVQYFSPKQN